MRDFSPDLLDALIEAIDRRRAERSPSLPSADTLYRPPLERRLMEEYAQRTLMSAYRSARRTLSADQVAEVIKTAERRIARVKYSPRRLNPSRLVLGLSAQELAEIYQAGAAQAHPDDETQE